MAIFETGSEGPKLWLNELMVTKSIAKREFQKHNYEKASQYCERLLELSDDDFEVPILLSKCHQNMLQPELAYTNHLLAEAKFPYSFLVIENGASVLLDIGQFEQSLMKYFQGAKKRKQPPVFTLGILKASQKINDSTKLRNEKFGETCLGNVALKFAKQGDLENVFDVNSILKKNDLIDRRNLNSYLDHLAQNKKYFEKVLKSSGPKYPFYTTDKKMHNIMKRILNAFSVAEVQLYARKQLYINKCEVHQMGGARFLLFLSHSKIIKDMEHIQVAKYLNTIIQLIVFNKIKESQQKMELLISYTENVKYNSNEIFDVIYRSFGMAQYLLFQNINRWSDEVNHQRMRVLLGATKNLSSIPIQESLFGPYDPNLKVTKNKLLAKIGKAKCTMEKIYLNFELSKCYMQLGSNYLKISRNKAYNCLQLAKELKSHTWIANSLIMGASAEFQLNKKQKCQNLLKDAIKITHIFQVSGVTMFLEKMLEMTSQIEAADILPNDVRRAEIVKLMPSMSMKMKALHMFRQLDTMPANRQISLVSGVILKHTNTKYSSAQAAHKYLSISPGSQVRRLGIQEFMLHKKDKLRVNIL